LALGKEIFFKKKQNSLPSAKASALGKDFFLKKNKLCLVLGLWHSAKKIYIKKQNGVTRWPTASNFCRMTAWHSTKPLPSARDLALGKAGFTVRIFFIFSPNLKQILNLTRI
jgi:hypothetical protein